MITHKDVTRGWRSLLTTALVTATLAQIAIDAAPAHAAGATGDGSFTLSESVTAPEVPDSAGILAQFSGTDSLGLPTFPAGTNTTTCTITSSAGIAVLLATNTLLPCGVTTADAGNGTADRIIIDGYVIIPDGATELSLQMSNDHPSATTLYVGGNHLYSASSDDRSELAYMASVATPFESVGSVESTVASLSATSVCANSPSVAFRAYVYDAAASHAFILKWRVVGGANDTGGAYQAIPSTFFSSLTGYDNDLDNDGTPDYQEIDTDGDSIPDWQEMGEAIEGDTLDSDSDGNPDCSDSDSDNDGSADGTDPNRLTPTATGDTIDTAQQALVNTNLAANDTEFAGSNNTVTDLTTGTAAGHTLSSTGLLTWDTTGVATGVHTIDYQICNDAVAPPVCATATATINLSLEAELETTVIYPSSAAAPGDESTFTVALTNNGASGATNAIVSIALPTGTVLGAASLPTGCTELTTTTVQCTHAGTANQTESYIIPVLVNPGASPNSTLTGGSAAATSDQPDPVPANNTTAIQLPVGQAITDFTAPQASPAPAPLNPNDTHTLQISTTNNGPSNAPGAPQTVVNLPNGINFDQTAPNPANCAITTAGPPQTITCAPTATPAVGAEISTSLPLKVGSTTACLTDITATAEQLTTDPTAAGSILITLPLAPGDSDADTISNSTEIGPDCNNPPDTDSDGTPDYFDTDSDNDNILDSDEVGPSGDVDSDGDGVVDRLDALGATITGNVFLDGNIDGIQQSGEEDISGVVVQLVSSGPDATFGTTDDIVIATDTTQSPYQFVNIDDGDYIISLDPTTLPYAVYATSTTGTNVTVSDATATFESEPSFGEFYASISGTLTDSDDNPVANAVVTMIDADGNTLTATTDANGNYLLQGSANSPIVRGTVVIAAVIDGRPERRSIEVAGAQRSVGSIARSSQLPVTGSSRTSGLVQVGMLAILAGALLQRVQRVICSSLPIGGHENMMK